MLTGLFIEPGRLWHYSVELLTGAGGLSDEDHPDHNSDAFFVLEPAAHVQLNIADHAKLGVGVSYRYVAGVDHPALSDSDLRGLSLSVHASFGKF